jgi:hypothetical protein
MTAQKNLSFAQVLDGVIEADDIPGLENLCLQHKNWGAFAVRVPSYVIVRLVDTIRLLREHGAAYYVTSEGRPSSPEDVVLTEAERLVDADEDTGL